jgi:hypothetical protein
VSRRRQEPTQDDARSLARWENEGGASKREPTRKTLKGLEIPVPKRKNVLDALRRIARPAKKTR